MQINTVASKGPGTNVIIGNDSTEGSEGVHILKLGTLSGEGVTRCQPGHMAMARGGARAAVCVREPLCIELKVRACRCTNDNDNGSKGN